MLCFRKDLDYDHYGLKKLKKRVLEYLAVRQIKTTHLKGPILCFVGPPGVGKTSIGRSIATTLGREFHRYQGQCHLPSTIVTSPQPLSPPRQPLSSPLNHCHLPVNHCHLPSKTHTHTHTHTQKKKSCWMLHRYWGCCHHLPSVFRVSQVLKTLSPPLQKHTQRNNMILKVSQVMRMLSPPSICVESFKGNKGTVMPLPPVCKDTIINSSSTTTTQP